MYLAAALIRETLTIEYCETVSCEDETKGWSSRLSLVREVSIRTEAKPLEQYLALAKNGEEIARFNDVVTCKRWLDRSPDGHRMVRLSDGALLSKRGPALTRAEARAFRRAMGLDDEEDERRYG